MSPLMPVFFRQRWQLSVISEVFIWHKCYTGVSSLSPTTVAQKMTHYIHICAGNRVGQALMTRGKVKKGTSLSRAYLLLGVLRCESHLSACFFSSTLTISYTFCAIRFFFYGTALTVRVLSRARPFCHITIDLQCSYSAWAFTHYGCSLHIYRKWRPSHSYL